jgi:hypothetical protein
MVIDPNGYLDLARARLRRRGLAAVPLRRPKGLVSIAFGFYLATSSFAPSIRNVVTSIINAFSHHG